jgi:hypothetical protein
MSCESWPTKIAGGADWQRIALLLVTVAAVLLTGCSGMHVEQRDQVAHLRGPYNAAFFHRHHDAFASGAAFHFAHGKQHDVLELTPMDRADRWDMFFDAESVAFLLNPSRTEPSMMMYAPYVGRGMWKLYRAIDWTHMHHEQTYDILSDASIPWDQKQRWTDRAVEYYLKHDTLARSPAPLDVTMRRAGVMMKPYFGAFRNNYPRSNNFFYVAHWWHPAVYEAMMIAGNGPQQEQILAELDQVMFQQVLDDRPQRMLLSREMMPRYSRLTSESANIFDNLHMLHGIAYDILAYEGWTIEQKRREMYRVLEAMSEHPGDRELARKFPIPDPELDPRDYADWLKGPQGEMSRIMMEMLEEMWPHMSPDGGEQVPDEVMDHVRMKLTPGMQEGEIEGSLHDAIMQIVPDMQMDHEMMEPGVTPQMMIDAMLQGWRDKHGDTPDIELWPMDAEPSGVASGHAWSGDILSSRRQP